MPTLAPLRPSTAHQDVGRPTLAILEDTRAQGFAIDDLVEVTASGGLSDRDPHVRLCSAGCHQGSAGGSEASDGPLCWPAHRLALADNGVDRAFDTAGRHPLPGPWGRGGQDDPSGCGPGSEVDTRRRASSRRMRVWACRGRGRPEGGKPGGIDIGTVLFGSRGSRKDRSCGAL